MTTYILSSILLFIFLVLAFIHFNWVVGGQWGYNQSLPTKENGELLFKPKRIDSAIVGFILLFFGVFYFCQTGFIVCKLPFWVLKYGSWIIPILFTIRAIGNFKYVGFFKKVKNTSFAKADTYLFSPLCLFIGITGFLILFF